MNVAMWIYPPSSPSDVLVGCVGHPLALSPDLRALHYRMRCHDAYFTKLKVGQRMEDIFAPLALSLEKCYNESNLALLLSFQRV